MWQFLYAESKDRLELLPVDDGDVSDVSYKPGSGLQYSLWSLS